MTTIGKQITRKAMAAITKTLAAGAMLIVAGALLLLPALAQEHKDHHQTTTDGDVIIGKKGQVHFTDQVKAGDAILKSGMYQVQHVEEGSDHFIVFKAMSMPAGYRMGNTPVGKEVARIKCMVEPVTKKVSNTRITLRTNAAGEKEIAEVQIAGETFKHVM